MEDLTSMIQELMNNNNNHFEKLYTKIEDLTTRVSSLETSINNGTLSNINSNINNNKPITDKVSYLNENVTNIIGMTIYDVFKDKIRITDEILELILNNGQCVYDTISDIIVETIVDTPKKMICSFKTSQNTIYFWSHEKQSWDKMNKEELKKIVDDIQQELNKQFGKYKKKNNLSIDEIINGNEKILGDSFDKEYKKIKKYICKGVCM